MTQKIVDFVELTMKECNIPFVHEATKFAYRPGCIERAVKGRSLGLVQEAGNMTCISCVLPLKM